MLRQWRTVRCPGMLQPDATIQLPDACVQTINQNLSVPFPYAAIVERSPLLLSKPGQWAYDKRTGALFYMPLPGEDMARLSAVIPSLETVVNVTQAKNVVFAGLEFAHTNWQAPSAESGFMSYQADVYIGGNGEQIPAAMDCQGCTNVAVMNSTFANLGTAGLRVRSASNDVLVFRNRFTQIAASAMQIGYLSSADTSNVYIEDNRISHIGNEYFSSPAIFATYASYMRIAHNEIVDVPYTGISVGWGWSSRNEYAHHNVIEGNRIRCAMRVLTDGGAIYLLSRQVGTRVQHNAIDQMNTSLAALLGMQHLVAVGIYLDNGTSQVTVNNNVIADVAKLEQAMFMNSDPLVWCTSGRSPASCDRSLGIPPGLDANGQPNEGNAAFNTYEVDGLSEAAIVAGAGPRL